MKLKYFLMFVCLAGLSATTVHAMEGMLATPETISQLKKDLREGHIRIGQTRLGDVIQTYGKAVSITDEDRRIVFDYDDIRVEFIKRRMWKDWSYDGFRNLCTQMTWTICVLISKARSWWATILPPI